MASLKQMAERLNRERLGGKAPVDKIHIRWNHRLRASAGNCIANSDGTFTIGLSEEYHRDHPDEVEATLLHELCHTLPGTHNHGSAFKAVAQRAGAIRYTAYRTEHRPRNIVYQCPRCGFRIYRAKRLASGRFYRCGRCNTRMRLEEA